MAQGAKPGEGGQLPGHKVDRYIAGVRLTTPGRRPDLAAAAPRHLLDRGPEAADLRPALREPQRAHLGEARRRGRRRHGRRGCRQGERRPRPDLGSRRRHGASPLSSILFAGIPWEIGLAETQQTLVLNDLRSRIWVQTDGQLKTGRDVVVAAISAGDTAPAPRVVASHVVGGFRSARPLQVAVVAVIGAASSARSSRASDGRRP